MVCDILAGKLLTSLTEDNNDSALRHSTLKYTVFGSQQMVAAGDEIGSYKKIIISLP